MALPSTGLTSNSPKNFIIDAATIFTEFEYDGTEFTGTSLGATSGGVKVAISVNRRKIAVDGAGRMDVKGLQVLDSATCVVTAPLKEFSAAALVRSINGTATAAETTEAPDGYQKVVTKRLITDDDYVPAIGVVGILAGSGNPVVFTLRNGLVTNALEMDFKDGNEAIIEQEITAHASIDELNADDFPWAIYYPEAGTTTTSGTAPFTVGETEVGGGVVS